MQRSFDADRVAHLPGWHQIGQRDTDNGWLNAYGHDTDSYPLHPVRAVIVETDLQHFLGTGPITDERRTSFVDQAASMCAKRLGTYVTSTRPLACPIDGYVTQCSIHEAKKADATGRMICFAWVSKSDHVYQGTVMALGSTGNQDAMARDGLKALQQGLPKP
ncbi:hypothetical protein [Lysobacter sp. TY2-98]|uniref:hypothetical protein n=1 Tax=Lysobacter sp. TY2-98 TaxID=2290922 RepID=UPI0013B40DCB|nr:hypothetical protein [Lysobacter sp. TY2-98]